MLDDGSLDWDEAQREIALRVHHASGGLPGQILRLDLYRLICYFHTSKSMANSSDWEHFCLWQGLRDEFQNSEIIRILHHTAVTVRSIGFGHADEKSSTRELIEGPVGQLFKSRRTIRAASFAARSM